MTKTDKKYAVEFTKEEADAINWAIDMMDYYGSTDTFWEFPSHSAYVCEGLNELTQKEAEADFDIISQEGYCGVYTWSDKNNPYCYGEASDKLQSIAHHRDKEEYISSRDEQEEDFGDR